MYICKKDSKKGYITNFDNKGAKNENVWSSDVLGSNSSISGRVIKFEWFWAKKDA